jgi:hypothetical protein
MGYNYPVIEEHGRLPAKNVKRDGSIRNWDSDPLSLSQGFRYS